MGGEYSGVDFVEIVEIFMKQDDFFFYAVAPFDQESMLVSFSTMQTSLIEM